MLCSGLFTYCPHTLFHLYMSSHVLLVAILFFGLVPLYLAGVFLPVAKSLLVVVAVVVVVVS